MTAENKTLEISFLPSITWNRLKVNSAHVEVPDVAFGGAKLLVKNPGETITENEITAEEADKWADELGGAVKRESLVAGKRAMYARQRFATGLGREFDDYLSAAVPSVNVYRVKAGTRAEAPVILDWEFEKGGSAAARQIIYAEAGSESTFILISKSGPDAEGLSLIGTKIVIEDGATLHLVKVNMLGKGYLQLDDTGVIEGEKSHFDFVQMELGGARTYVGAYVDMRGDKSTFLANNGFMACGENLVDMNYVAVQRGRKTDSKIYVKGVLKDRGQKVFRGTIDFRLGSHAAKGDEREEVLLLSPDIVNKTLPIILCEEEDVEGGHGATIGNLSDDVLFYLETRGISKNEAERLVTLARLKSVSRLIPDEDVRRDIKEFVAEEFGTDEKL